jgi:hypothetical protein
VGLHAEAVWKPVSLVPPRRASFSRFGVSMSNPPYGVVSLKPRSSATIMRKLGRVGAGIVVWLLGFGVRTTGARTPSHLVNDARLLNPYEGKAVF